MSQGQQLPQGSHTFTATGGSPVSTAIVEPDESMRMTFDTFDFQDPPGVYIGRASGVVIKITGAHSGIGETPDKDGGPPTYWAFTY